MRRTVLGALGGAAGLVALGLYWILVRGAAPFGIIALALATPLVVGSLRVFLRLRAGDEGARLASSPWNGPGASLLISRPLATADDLLRRYVVKVDGKTTASLDYGDAVQLDLDAGQHTVQALLDGTDKQSERLQVVCTAGRRSRVQVEPFAASTAVRKAVDQWITVSESS